jgi:hypothetical protein
VVLVLATIMVAGAWFEHHFSGQTLFVLGILVFGLWWIIAAIWFLSALVAFRDRVRWKIWLQWTIAPLVVIVLHGLFMPAFHLQFWLSRPSLERWAMQMANAPAGASVPEPFFNFIEINKPQPLPHGASFYTLVGGNWLDAQGLAYSSQPLPVKTNVNGRFYEPWCGNWYTFFEG